MSALTGAYVEPKALFALRHLRSPEPGRAVRVLGTQSGLKLSKQKGRGVDFAEVRLYQAGDDVRSIDWRVTARRNRTHTKVFREERERPTLIFCDQTQSLFFGSRRRLKSVAAAEAAARLAWQTLHDNDRVGGLVVGNAGYAVHKPKRSIKSTARYLNDVAIYNNQLSRGGQADEAQLSEALIALRRLAHTGFRIVLISDFATQPERWKDAIQALARRNQLTVVQVYDPLELALPEADLYTVTDGRTRLRLNTGERRLREHYAASYAQRAAQLDEICAHRAIRLFRFCTTDAEPPMRGV